MRCAAQLWPGHKENMMRWTITEFELAHEGGLARPFQFEIIARTPVDSDRGILRGDGLLFSDGRVRFNRESNLKNFASGLGANDDDFLNALSEAITEEAGLRPASRRTAIA